MNFRITFFVVLAILAGTNSAFKLKINSDELNTVLETLKTLNVDIPSLRNLLESEQSPEDVSEEFVGFSVVNSSDVSKEGALVGNATYESTADSDDLVMTTIAGHGYPAEAHFVTTSDGYILRMHRIPSSPNHIGTENKTRQPVLLVHGMMDSSGTYVLMGPNQSLAYMLADAGYDVWMGNVRGNRYSRKHRTLNPDGFRPERKQFWHFSWHEIGMIDLPAMIDHILAKNTAFKKVHYIGHSQGTTSFFVMASRRPEYNEKILLMNALAPVAFMEHLESRISRTMHKFQKLIEVSMATFGVYELLANDGLATRIQKALCMGLIAETCDNLILSLFGFNPDMIDPSKLPLIRQHTPAGASTRQLMHYGQLMRRDTGYRAFDFGHSNNIRMYDSPSPPQYPLDQITAPIALHYGLKDEFAAVVDVQRLAKALPNVIDLNEIAHPEFGHLDLVWANEVRTLVYNHMLELMKKADAQ